MNKKIILLLPMLSLLVTGCNPNQGDFRKIGDHLYEYTLTDDSYLSGLVDTSVNALGATFGCSAVQNGNLRGRNYDWTFADTDICVTHANKTNKRKYANIGVSDLSFIASDEKGNYDISKLDYSRIFTSLVDGVNEAGMCVQTNVLPYGENFTSEVSSYYHTSSTSDDLKASFVCRYLLDITSNIEEAINVFYEKDVNPVLYDNEYHWMISGPTSKTDKSIKTIVVEIFPAKDKKDIRILDEFIDDKPIMTNFNMNNFNKGYVPGMDNRYLVGMGTGYERWQILEENYNQGTTIMGMFNLMKKAWFSKMYDLYSDRFWYSEYNLAGLSKFYEDKNELKNMVDLLLYPGAYDMMMETYGDIIYNPYLFGDEGPIHGDLSKTGVIAPVARYIQDAYERQDKSGLLWISIETSIYDLENKTLNLSVRESQDLLSFSL